jgi:hypothetical protein
LTQLVAPAARGLIFLAGQIAGAIPDEIPTAVGDRSARLAARLTSINAKRLAEVVNLYDVSFLSECARWLIAFQSRIKVVV